MALFITIFMLKVYFLLFTTSTSGHHLIFVFDCILVFIQDLQISINLRIIDIHMNIYHKTIRLLSIYIYYCGILLLHICN
jgi:hypothetical protein